MKIRRWVVRDYDSDGKLISEGFHIFRWSAQAFADLVNGRSRHPGFRAKVERR